MTAKDTGLVTLAARLKAAAEEQESVLAFVRLVSGRQSGRDFETAKRNYYRWVGGGKPEGHSHRRLIRWARKVGKPDNYFTSAEVPSPEKTLVLEERLQEAQGHLATLEARVGKLRSEWKQADANLTQLVDELTERVDALEPPAAKARRPRKQ